MKVNTALELVRYIRHHLAGSEWQDVKAVEDFVALSWSELRDLLNLPSTNNDRLQVINEIKRLKAIAAFHKEQ